MVSLVCCLFCYFNLQNQFLLFFLACFSDDTVLLPTDNKPNKVKQDVTDQGKMFCHNLLLICLV